MKSEPVKRNKSKRTTIGSPFSAKASKANKSLMFATFRKKKKSNQFDKARSRRGSSFVDDYNVNDTLFFDGEEENDSVNDSEQFYVDDMGSDDDENDKNNNNDVVENGLKGI